MIPAGYMYKSVAERPDWRSKNAITRIYSVSPCISRDFAEWIHFWKHNGYWFFDSPSILSDLAVAHGISLDEMTLFYYRVHEKQWHPESRSWLEFSPEPSFTTNVIIPDQHLVAGYDVVTYSTGNSAECSPLSCNLLAEDVPTNEHCLLASLEDAVALIEAGAFRDCEPGPLRVIEVSTLAS